MGYLKYKGYTGSVEYSEDDKCLFGKVQGMSKDSITYEGDKLDCIAHCPTVSCRPLPNVRLQLDRKMGVLRYSINRQLPSEKQRS